MKRRDFVKKLSAAGTIPFLLDGISFNSMSYAAPLQRLASMCPNDNVLIILQMHGGNDGINMLIPYSQYDRSGNDHSVSLAQNFPKNIF